MPIVGRLRFLSGHLPPIDRSSFCRQTQVQILLTFNKLPQNIAGGYGKKVNLICNLYLLLVMDIVGQ